eukprot:scaffold58510_cov66-Phaeocystis_antarctica.AAC.4
MRTNVRGASDEHASSTSVAWCVVGTRMGQDARRTGQERGRRRGGELRVARCGLARLQRAVLGHDLHECLEALDAVLELESREAVAVEPRLLGAVELLRGGTQAARSPHHLHLLCEERLLAWRAAGGSASSAPRATRSSCSRPIAPSRVSTVAAAAWLALAAAATSAAAAAAAGVARVAGVVGGEPRTSPIPHRVRILRHFGQLLLHGPEPRRLLPVLLAQPLQLERRIELGYRELPLRAECVEAARLLDVEGAQPLEQRAALGAVQPHLPHELCEDRVVVVLLRLSVVLVRAQQLLEALRQHDSLGAVLCRLFSVLGARGLGARRTVCTPPRLRSTRGGGGHIRPHPWRWVAVAQRRDVRAVSVRGGRWSPDDLAVCDFEARHQRVDLSQRTSTAHLALRLPAAHGRLWRYISPSCRNVVVAFTICRHRCERRSATRAVHHPVHPDVALRVWRADSIGIQCREFDPRLGRLKSGTRAAHRAAQQPGDTLVSSRLVSAPASGVCFNPTPCLGAESGGRSSIR